jgi:hypothetical protein
LDNSDRPDNRDPIKESFADTLPDSPHITPCDPGLSQISLFFLLDAVSLLVHNVGIVVGYYQ